jgi:hypothetical protein
MTIANKLVAQGESRSAAMVKAWAVVNAGTLESKVSGVTVGKRQTAIERLTRYDAEAITVRLNREPLNAYDKNAIAVMVSVSGSAEYQIGYVPANMARIIAPLMDARKSVGSAFKAIVGGWADYLSYGMRIQVNV